jgi:hypothetical protein
LTSAKSREVVFLDIIASKLIYACEEKDKAKTCQLSCQDNPIFGPFKPFHLQHKAENFGPGLHSSHFAEKLL